jgi:hypothetical protein
LRAHLLRITHIFIPIGPGTDEMAASECGLIVISPFRRLIEYFDANSTETRAKNYGHATIEVRVNLLALRERVEIDTL